MNTIIAQKPKEIYINPSCCSLCGQKLLGEQTAFCCRGCEAVYEILASKNELGEKERHPLYLQALQYGVINNSELKVEGLTTAAGRWVVEIQGMWCPACAVFISLMMKQLKGVRFCSVDYMTDLASIEIDPMAISKEEVVSQIKKWGYTLLELKDIKSKQKESSLTLRLAIAFFCALNVMMFTYPLFSTFFDTAEEGMAPLLSWVSLGLTLPVVTYSAWPIYRRFYFGLRQGFLGMEALVVLGIAASLAVSLYEMAVGTHRVYFDTVTMLIALLLFGKAIEQKAKFSSKEAQFKLHLMNPRKARRKKSNGSFEIVSVKEVRPGDVLQVLSGERVVLDGIVTKGQAAMDESSMTGESKPIAKALGSPVLSGAIVLSGVLEVKALVNHEESALKKLIFQTERALQHKTTLSHAADTIAQMVTPIVLSITIASFALFLSLDYGFQEAFLRAASALLIACPCAIGIAAPLAESGMIDTFSKRGAIVRNRSLFSQLAKASLYVFDKTGTLTEGSLEVVKGINELNHDQLIRLKSLSTCSLHPAARAITAAVVGDNKPIENVQEFPGLGMKGEIDGKSISLGASRWLVDRGLYVDEHQTLHSFSCFEEEGKVVAKIELKDRLRQGVDSLPNPKILLSGDREPTVRTVAQELGFSTFYHGMTPKQKQEKIAELKAKGDIVVFVGDGMNDAPSLAEANVGVSVLQASDMAYQVSDLYLLNGRLDTLQELVDAAKKGERIQSQNFFWAFFYNALGIPLALSGVLSPLFATFAMTASSLIVLLNSKRITSRESLYRSDRQS
ncbi:MAG: heavy metal translocating P-type ATPase [Parachlamydiaceae bacterium]